MGKSRNPSKQYAKENHSQKPQDHHKPHSWAAVRSLFTCKYLQVQHHQHRVQQQQAKVIRKTLEDDDIKISSHKTKKHMKIGKKQQTPEESNKKFNNGADDHVVSNNSNNNSSSSSSSNSSSFTVVPSSSPSVPGSFRNMPFRKLSGCYECRMVVDPVLGMMTRDPSLRASICSCPECGEIFMKPENLELHQAVRHAVSELGPEDTSKNIVEIIFQSSWLKKRAPVCKIDRILKVHNTPKTISKFEEYRDTIRTKATGLQQPKKHPRCLADGNELLRFHCTTLMCPLGLNGSSNLCNSIPRCGVCSIIKNGFKVTSEALSLKGILTTATSGKAHDICRVAMDDDHGKRAMLVCRVIAGRVKKNPDGYLEDYDSIGEAGGGYSNLDDLYVFDPKAILPCFVVIYRGF